MKDIPEKAAPPTKPTMVVQIAVENPISSTDVAILYVLTDQSQIFYLRNPVDQNAVWKQIL